MKPLKPRRLVEGGGQGPEAAQMRELLSQVSHERFLRPGEEQALRERVWRRFADGKLEENRPRFAAPWLAGAAAACAILLGALALRTPAPEPAVIEPSHSGVLALGDRARVLAQPDAQFSIAEKEGTTRIHLERGELLARTAAGPERAFEIEAGDVHVHGAPALFSVRALRVGAAVSVGQGAVELESLGRSVRVAAGQSWSSEKPGELGTAPIPAADRAQLDDLPDALPTAPRAVEPRSQHSSPPVATITSLPDMGTRLPPGHPRASGPAPLAPTTPLAPTPLAPAFPPRAQSVAIAAHAPPAPALFKEISSAPARESPGADAANAPLPPISGPARKPAVQLAAAEPIDPYRAAEQLLGRGQFAEAARAFEQIVAQHGAHADLALYELGRVRERNLNDLPGALQAFRRYRAEYPNGALAQEVSLSLIETELAGTSPQDRTAAFDESSAFLAAHPQSERAAEMRLLRGNLMRETGDCEKAISEYRQAGGSYAEEALWFTAFCEHKQGRRDEARDTLRSYLARFPDGEHRAQAAAALESNGP